MKKSQNFLEWNNDVFISSMKKIDANIILTVILDTLFYAISGYIVIFWLQRLQDKIQAFNLPSDVMSLGREGARQLVSDEKSFYFLIIFSFILVLLIIIFLASILKGIIWAKTAGAKISFRLISKFLGLNLIWMGFWFLVIFLISWLVEPASTPKFMMAAIALALYFTNTLYAIFMKEQSVASIFKAVKLNISKIHLFLLPYAVLALLLFIIIRVGSMLKLSYSVLILGMVLVIYAAFARQYASELVLSIRR